MKRMSIQAVRFAIVALLLLVSGPPGIAQGAEGYKVIVNAANPVSSLPREQVARYFLKKTTSWQAGGPRGAGGSRPERCAPRRLFA